MIFTNDLFLRFANDGRAVDKLKLPEAKNLAKESIRLALGMTPPIKDITIKHRESESSAFSIVDFELGGNTYVLEKDLNYVSLRLHVGGSAISSRIFISHIENLALEPNKASETNKTA